MNPDHLLSSYRFDLPEALIAQHPAPRREDSRLLVVRQGQGVVGQGTFADLPAFLPEQSLLVANNSRVAPVRMEARLPLAANGQGGGRVEVLLLTPPPLLSAVQDGDELVAEAEALLRPAKKFPPGTTLALGSDFSLTVLERGDFGRCRVLLRRRGELQPLLETYGQLPLPPYIQRPDGLGAEDAERYQTTFGRADKAGSAAAPTAGLHFTPTVRQALQDSGRAWAEVTLYVGYGTFSPVRCEDIREHPMHAEYVELSAATVAAVNSAKVEGRPVTAVGTTSARVLEGVHLAQHGEAAGFMPLEPFAGWINIFLYPGRQLRVVDALITNFHLPESSLLMLVSALAGREVILEAYRRAVAEKFRFFSYGDAMLILP